MIKATVVFIPGSPKSVYIYRSEDTGDIVVKQGPTEIMHENIYPIDQIPDFVQVVTID